MLDEIDLEGRTNVVCPGITTEGVNVPLGLWEGEKLPAAIRLARRAMRIVMGNIALSLASIVILTVAALAGWLSLTTGLLLNEGMARLIIANGLRLLRARTD
jgi:Cd2+/Zn2+-exporting ATPase